MCRHERVTFLGYQSWPGVGAAVPLFNCCACLTTLSLDRADPRLRAQANLPAAAQMRAASHA